MGLFFGKPSFKETKVISLKITLILKIVSKYYLLLTEYRKVSKENSLELF
jgi:hypothetical protein